MIPQGDLPSNTQGRASSRKSLALRAAALAVLALGVNLLFDSTYCVVSPCLTKWSAFRSIHVGMDAQQAGILYRAGAFCPGEEGPSSACTQFTFSDFSRDYLVQIDPVKRIVLQKKFGFRFLHILR